MQSYCCPITFTDPNNPSVQFIPDCSDTLVINIQHGHPVRGQRGCKFFFFPGNGIHIPICQIMVPADHRNYRNIRADQP